MPGVTIGHNSVDPHLSECFGTRECSDWQNVRMCAKEWIFNREVPILLYNRLPAELN